MRDALIVSQAAHLAGTPVHFRPVNGYGHAYVGDVPMGVWFQSWGVAHPQDAARIIAEVNALDETILRQKAAAMILDPANGIIEQVEEQAKAGG